MLTPGVRRPAIYEMDLAELIDLEKPLECGVIDYVELTGADADDPAGGQ